MSPIMDSSLGLNRIKTRPGPLIQENLAMNRMSSLGSSNLMLGSGSKLSEAAGDSSGKKKGLEKVTEKFESSLADGGGRGKDWADDLRFRNKTEPLDISATAFYKSLPVIDFAAEFLELRDVSHPLAETQCVGLKKAERIKSGSYS